MKHLQHFNLITSKSSLKLLRMAFHHQLLQQQINVNVVQESPRNLLVSLGGSSYLWMCGRFNFSSDHSL